MVSRDTLPLPVIKEDDLEKVGVIGMTPGSGVSFICSLLQKEMDFIRGSRSAQAVRLPEIIDLSEAQSGMEVDRVLIVLDCRKGRIGSLMSAVDRFKRRNTACAVVFNRWTGGFGIPDELLSDKRVKIIKVPEINGDMFKGLYNFVFYSQ